MKKKKEYSLDFILDLELLEACREEFHRRLKVYHAWKSKSRKGKNPSALDDKIDEADDERAPNDILNNGKFNYLIIIKIIVYHRFTCISPNSEAN